MIDCVSLLCEILAALLLMHNLLGKKFITDIKLIVLLTSNVMIFYLVNNGIFPVYVQLIVYIILFVYLKMEFWEIKLGKIIAALLCTYFIVCGLEVSIFYVLKMLDLGLSLTKIANIIIFVIILILCKFFDWGNLFKHVSNAKYGLKHIILGCGVLSVFLVIGLKIYRSFSLLETMLFYAIFLIVIAFLYQWKIQHDIIILREREIKWLEQCNESFDKLITDVRSRQHEFNNRIDAICGMQYSCDTYEELVQQINKYAGEVIKENRFNKLLAMDCSPIVKGFLYYRFCRADSKGFQIDYQISLNADIDYSVIFDISEIVGILFDNACEALLKNNMEKQVLIYISDYEKEIAIEVDNKSPYISFSESSLFVKKGYSTKSNVRGYGLFNVKRIVQKYKGNIAINNIEKSGENWFQIIARLNV